jgi:uncharacterized protein YqgV (UPF0045/DUF77 family)
MKISVDISLYPLIDTYLPEIDLFIEKMRNSGLVVLENPLSTQLYGDYDVVMDFIKKEVKATFLNNEHCVFSMKFIHGDRTQA